MSNTIILAAGPNGLGVVRSLYLEGVDCQIITLDKDDISHHSRIPSVKMHIIGTTEKEQHQWLLDTLSKQPAGSVLIPTSDWFVTFLSDNIALREKFSFVIPEQKLSEIIIDKAKETELVNKIIPIPKTIQNIQSSEQLISQLSLPIIIKPRSHKHMVLDRKNIVISSQDELLQFFKQFGDKLSSVIAQEVIPGKDNQQWVCNCFFDENNDMVQAFTFNRLRLSPAHYGVTSYAISTLNQDVIDLSRKLGKKLKYSGPAMIEFKQDPRDLVYKYIEINPRLGMCNYFDTACGVNNPYLTYLLSLKKPLPFSLPKVKENVIFISVFEDLYARYHDGESFYDIFRDYLSDILKPHVFIYFVWWDPMPALKLAVKQLSSVIKSIVRKGMD